MALRMTFCVKLLKTFIMTFSWICLGFYSELLGPSLPTLRSQVNATTEEMERVLSARSFGLLLGSLVSGFLHDRFDKRRVLITGLAVGVAGGLILILPVCRELWILGIILFFIGVCHAFHTTGGNPILVDIWVEKSPGPLNLLHSGYGIGAAVTPLIIQAFAKSDVSGYLSFYSTTNSTIPAPDIELIYPYAILSGSCLLCATLLVLMALLDRRQRPPSVMNIEDPTENKDSNLPTEIQPSSKLTEFWTTMKSSPRNYKFTIALLVTTFVFYFIVAGGDRVHSRFLFTYAIESDLEFTEDEAFTLNSLFWVGYTIGRLVMAFVLIWAASDAILCVELMGSVVTSATLLFAPGDKSLFWFGCFAFAFMKSPTYPTGLAVLNNYLEVSGIVLILVGCGGAAGDLVMQWTSGLLYTLFGPSIVLYAAIGHTLLLITVGSLMIFLGHMKGSRFASDIDTKSEVTFSSTESEDNSRTGKIREMNNEEDKTNDGQKNKGVTGIRVSSYYNEVYGHVDTKL